MNKNVVQMSNAVAMKLLDELPDKIKIGIEYSYVCFRIAENKRQGFLSCNAHWIVEGGCQKNWP